MNIFDYYGKEVFERQIPELIGELHRIGDVLNSSLKAKNIAVRRELPTNDAEGNVGVTAVFICYEENSPALYNEAGNVEHLFITKDMEDVLLWLDMAFRNAGKMGFHLIDRDERNKLYAAVETGNSESAWVYRNGDENAEDYYAIKVRFQTLSADPVEIFD